MNRTATSLFLAVVASLASCSGSLAPVAPLPPQAAGVSVVDGTNEDTMNASIDALRRDMTQDERTRFTDALLRIGSRRSLAVLRESGGDLEAVNRALREDLHGKTVAQILAAGAQR
ncbi:MAG: hypothetical protein JNL28_01095 [Planctomycetes bacterium]|nr:hypothetical protein [Planctomycetota bacterium]